MHATQLDSQAQARSLAAARAEGRLRAIKLAVQQALIYIFLVVSAAAFLLPVLWLFLNTFKPKTEIFEHPSFALQHFTLINYNQLLTATPFIRWYQNSLIVAVCHTLLALFFCSLAGYTFAKHNFPGKNLLFGILLATVMIPGVITLIPLFIWYAQLHVINTYGILILPGSASVFGIFMMRQYIQSVPSEILDSARIDGCSEFRIYWNVILPVITPALGALTIFMFMESWNSFMGPLIFMRTPNMFTVPVGLSSLVGQDSPEYGMLMAGSVFSVLPLVVIFFAMQRQLVAGLTLGAIKGE